MIAPEVADAIETLGELVACASEEAGDALDVLKDALTGDSVVVSRASAGANAAVERLDQLVLRYGDADDRAALDTVAFLADTMPAAQPRLMGAREACLALGVHSGNLYKVPGLPEPVADLAAGKVWDASAIEELAATREGARRV